MHPHIRTQTYRYLWPFLGIEQDLTVRLHFFSGGISVNLNATSLLSLLLDAEEMLSLCLLQNKPCHLYSALVASDMQSTKTNLKHKQVLKYCTHSMHMRIH